MTVENIHSEAVEALAEVVLGSSLRRRMQPYFYGYFGQHVATKEGARHYFRQNAVIARECKIEGKDVIDVGCGFGLRSVCLALLGARKVIGVDVSRGMIEGFGALRQEFPLLDVEAMEGDFVSADFPENSQDVAVLVAAISHIRDTDDLLDKIRRVLRPKGILYVLDDNNDLFLPSRLRSRKVQRNAERQRFSEARMRILHDLCPTLNTKELNVLTRGTRGLYGEELAQAALEYTRTGKIPHRTSSQARDPRTGEFEELGLSPLALSKKLGKSGFRCQMLRPLPLYTGAPYWIPRWQAAAFLVARPVLRRAPTSLLPFIYPTFAILAEKEAGE